MSLYTQHYNLAAFLWGEVYSASLDQERFVSIDNHLAFISDQIGAGVIEGWTISDNEDGSVRIAPGLGIIDRTVCESLGFFEVSVDVDTSTYLFMKTSNEPGGISGNSNIASVVASDSMPPSVPSGLSRVTNLTVYLASLVSYTSDLILYMKQLLGIKEESDAIELVGYNQLAFKWDVSLEADFDYYIVRKLVNSVYVDLKETTEEIYIDVDLEQDTSYTYQVVAVDLSGNESLPSTITLSTDRDTRIPLPPTFLQLFPSNNGLQAVWDHSPSDNVEHYQVVLQELDQYYQDYGSPEDPIFIDRNSGDALSSTYVVFQNLTNSTYYKLTLCSVSDAGISSEEISSIAYVKSVDGAGEISSIEVDFEVDSLNNGSLVANLFWRYGQDNPSINPIHKFYITFIENGTRRSDTIDLLETTAMTVCRVGDSGSAGCYSISIKLLPFNEEGIIRYESIKEYSSYLILIQTVDIDGNISNGIFERVYRTPLIEQVSAISDLSITRNNDNSLLLKWTNPIESYFAYNKITITITDLTNFINNPSVEDLIYINNIRIDRADNFTIPASKFNVNYRYSVSITSYDVFDSVGENYSTFKQFTEEEDRLRPTEPSSVVITSGDTEVYLKWSMIPDEIPDIAYYKIYRATFSYYLQPSDFSLIATIPSSHTSFIDYTVVNDSAYTYFITSVDIYGNESLNNTEDLYMPSLLLSSTPHASSDLLPPIGLTVTSMIDSNGSDAILTWTATSGSFDGYEILRSDENNYSFEVVGYTTVSETTYEDHDALLKDEAVYYYLIRKYRNDVSLYSSSSSTESEGYVFIGEVVTSSGTSDVTIDTSDVRQLKNLEDPVKEIVQERLLLHKHTNSETDKRIELKTNVLVQDWTTLDYKTYTTTQDIEGATNYIILISGSINEEYFKDSLGNVNTAFLKQTQAGQSPILYEIIETEGQIIFNEPLYSTCISNTTLQSECPPLPYSSIPSVRLELIGVSEVDGLLPSNRVGDISATQISSGQIIDEQLPSIRHEGRFDENLIPLKLAMTSIDNVVYSLSSIYEEDRNKMGTAVTFYDFVMTSGTSQIVSATSSGVWLSNDFGNTWSQVATFPSSVHRIYRSNADNYYAITNYSVYINDGSSFRSWKKTGGLDYVKIIRDITEDNDGNIYISTDLGVFKLNSVDIPYIHDHWEKLAIFGVQSSESYAILYDSDFNDSSGSGRLLVSNELGLLQSTDQGRSWSYTNELTSPIKIRRFLNSQHSLFALADKYLYRKNHGDTYFTRVADIDVTVSRQIEIFNDRIYITTDKSAMGSVSYSIYYDVDIQFVSIWPEVNINNYPVVTTSIKKIESNLFIGADRKLFLMNNENKIWTQYDQKNTIIPTFYVDDSLQKLGFYYNNNGSYHNVSFDEMIGTESIVSVANMYDIYYTQYGGWVQNKYDASVVLYKNGNEFGRSKTIIEIDKTPFSSIVLPSYTDDNAHKEKADLYLGYLQQNIDSLVSSTESSGENIKSLISNIYSNFELFLSQIYEDDRVIVDSSGKTVQFVLPSINTNLVQIYSVTNNTGETVESEASVYYNINQNNYKSYEASINIVNGMFVFDLPFDRYDFLSIDIYEVTVWNSGSNTHRDIEDKFEYVYSGFPSQLSQTQQINLIKLGLFSQKTWPNIHLGVSPAFQADYIIPNDYNLIDELNSTINYIEEQSVDSGSASLNYVSSVIYVGETEMVIVGGIGTVLSININTMEIEKIDIVLESYEMVRSILRAADNLYLMTERRIFISTDFGVLWTEYNKSGLSNRFYSMGYISNNFVVGGEDGVYVQPAEASSTNWEKVESSTLPVTIMVSSNILFSVINKKIYLSVNGYSFADSGLGSNLDIIAIARYGYTNTYISSIQGLYSDNGSFNSTLPNLTEISTSILLQDGDTINDITTNSDDKTIMGASNGSYGLISENIMQIKESTSLDAIHKVLIINDDIWLFGRDKLKISSLDYPIKLSTGVPC